MIFSSRLFKLLVCLTLTVALIFSGLFPGIGQIHPTYAANVPKPPEQSYSNLPILNPSTNRFEVDKYLMDAVRSAHNSTEDFAASELEHWVDNLMTKVDDKFLNWYFSYANQKAMEFGIPFAWLVFAGDYSLNLLRKQDEKKLNPSQVLQNKMIEDFQNKFTELVLNPESAQESLYRITERVGQNYASALGMKFAEIKNAYKIPDGEWKTYLNDLATIIYVTGNSKYSISPESITSSLTTDLLIKSTAGIGGKFALNFATKAAAKIAAKAGGSIATKVAAQMVDPLLAIGILIWDTWDYNHMVNESRPVLRQNILDYLNEVKMSIFDAPENSIMAAIEEVEGKIITGLESRLTSEINGEYTSL